MGVVARTTSRPAAQTKAWFPTHSTQGIGVSHRRQLSCRSMSYLIQRRGTVAICLLWSPPFRVSLGLRRGTGPGEGQGRAEETGATSDAGGSVVRVRQAGQAGWSREEVSERAEHRHRGWDPNPYTVTQRSLAWGGCMVVLAPIIVVLYSYLVESGISSGGQSVC